MTEFSGHYTKRDGTHVQMTSEEAAILWAKSELYHAERAARLPDVQTALKNMFDAFDRLKELGWREAIYCPKDGSSFEVICGGSTGIFCCHYDGEWPDGGWWIEEDGDLWPSHPILFRLFPEDEAKRQAKMAEARAKYQAERDAEKQS
jgi:hypothetical protein